MERLGLLGGTFDPLHIGHLILASMAVEALALDAVWFVPAADPPHKQGRAVTPASHRLAMVALGIAGNPRFALSRIDVDRPGPHYSVDMVALAQQQAPQAAIFFLLGSDSLADLPTWHRPDLLLARCQLGVYQRPEAPVDVAALEAHLPGLSGRMIWIEGPGISLSASAIRERLQGGRSVRYLVPETVRTYIDAHRLYSRT
ncbi:MAG: nicotinate (nicotinamide) nucleotide adenylyltransferase [Anaerolineae bacterium]|nr:nicotinate (nicotinamide) nucleotide adenylyltransferase [Anaerolineae bacterium]